MRSSCTLSLNPVIRRWRDGRGCAERKLKEMYNCTIDFIKAECKRQLHTEAEQEVNAFMNQFAL